MATVTEALEAQSDACVNGVDDRGGAVGVGTAGGGGGVLEGARHEGRRAGTPHRVDHGGGVGGV